MSLRIDRDQRGELRGVSGSRYDVYGGGFDYSTAGRSREGEKEN